MAKRNGGKKRKRASFWTALLLAVLLTLTAAVGSSLAIAETDGMPPQETLPPDANPQMGEEPPAQTPVTPPVAEDADPISVPDPVPDPTSDPVPASDPEAPAAGETPVIEPALPESEILPPAAEPALPAVHFTLRNHRIPLGEAHFEPLVGISAEDENGAQLAVTVASFGGFDAEKAGEYTLTYRAVHPVSGEAFEATGAVTVYEPEDNRHYDNTRYELLKIYRDEICDALTTRMAFLADALSTYLAEVSAGASSLRLFAETGGETPLCTEVSALTVKNWDDILLIFVAENLPDTDNPVDLLRLRRIPIERLDRVFWDMTKVRVKDAGGAVEITLTGRGAEDMIALYGMSQKKAALVHELMLPEYQPIFASLTNNMNLIGSRAPAECGADGQFVLPDDVAAAACSLVGKVPYYWGGKYNELGWNPGWGLPRTEVNRGCRAYGQTSAYGLDCSGFVSWVFINAAGDTDALGRIGNGSSAQWRLSEPVAWEDAAVGDLAFFVHLGSSETNHVGIVVSVSVDGAVMVAHCTSNADSVIVSEARAAGFDCFRRPRIYGG